MANIGSLLRERNRGLLIRTLLAVFLMALTGPLGCEVRPARADAAKDVSEGWTEFVYADDGFAIHGPAQAQAVTEGQDALTHAYVISEGIGTSFLVKVTRNGSSRATNESVLKTIASHNPRVVKAIKQAGMQGVKYGFEDTDGASHGRILAGDGRIYTIFAQGPTAGYSVAGLDRWLDTFRLLPAANRGKGKP